MASRFIDELRVSAGAEDELARHGVDPDDVLDVLWDHPYFCRDKVADRKQMIGKTIGGRLLTIIIEQTGEQHVWDVVTGWPADKGEQTLWEKQRPRTG